MSNYYQLSPEQESIVLNWCDELESGKWRPIRKAYVGLHMETSEDCHCPLAVLVETQITEADWERAVAECWNENHSGNFEDLDELDRNDIMDDSTYFKWDDSEINGDYEATSFVSEPLNNMEIWRLGNAIELDCGIYRKTIVECTDTMEKSHAEIASLLRKGLADGTLILNSDAVIYGLPCHD